MKNYLEADSSLNNLSTAILQQMKRRERELITNNILLAGIFVDPKARPLLTNEQVCLAEQELCSIAAKLHHTELNPSIETSDNMDTSEVFNNSEDLFNSDNQHGSQISENLFLQSENFETRLDTIAKVRVEAVRSKNNDVARYKNRVREALPELQLYDRSHNLNNVIINYPMILHSVCFVVVSNLTSQTSVERLFSVLKFFMS